MSAMSGTTDQIIVNELSLRIPLGASTWPKPNTANSPQPVLLSLRVPFPLSQAGTSDELEYSLNYSSLAKTAEGVALSGKWKSMEALAHAVCLGVFRDYGNVEEVWICVEKPKGLLKAQKVGVELRRHRKPGKNVQPIRDKIFVRQLDLSTIIGIHPWERQEEQVVRLNFEVELEKQWGDSENESATAFDYRAVVAEISDHVIESSYQTVESLASSIAERAYGSAFGPSIHNITVRVAKPSALVFAESAEISITRFKTDFPSLFIAPVTSAQVRDGKHIVAIALGSNLGDRVGNIENALKTLEQHGVHVLDTSFLYETKPMYVEDQPSFVNGACLIRTTLEPLSLLYLLKETEMHLGRTRTFKNGPRVVDLDILLFDDLVYNNTPSKGEKVLDLIIPHIRMQEREFVLRPLADIIPDFIHPILNVSIKSLLDTLLLAHPPSQPTHKLISFSAPNNTPPDTEATIYTLQTCTYLMATLNITPDSFSDGNQHNTVSAALEYVRNATQAGADIIDIGGYSTRPGAKVVSPQEELRRIAPVIKAIRDDGITLPISVDTFRFEVAHEAILLGANCINDVHALADEGMLDLARHHAVPVIMMHSRGDAGKNKDYSPVGVIESIRTELGERVRVALEAGIRRWNLFVDPGIGFSKNVQDNVKMLRDLKKLTEPKPKSEGDARNSKQAQSQRDLREITLSYVKDAASGLNNLPTLVGTSRKSFLGHLIGRPLGDPKERGWATAAAVSAAVQQHVDFLRVHDVSEMVDVVMVADALWR